MDGKKVFTETEQRLGKAIGNILERKYGDNPAHKYMCRQCGKMMKYDVDFCDRCEKLEEDTYDHNW